MHSNRSYLRLAAMTLLSFAAMYVLMYAMVDRLSNIYPNINQAYMAALMAAPMVFIELGLMTSMYPNRKFNMLAIAIGAVVFVGSFAAIRDQSGIDDEQFLRSMIPHHAGAVLMCEQSSARDPEIGRLCQSIISSQRAEIDQMKELLAQHRRQQPDSR